VCDQVGSMRADMAIHRQEVVDSACDKLAALTERLDICEGACRSLHNLTSSITGRIADLETRVNDAVFAAAPRDPAAASFATESPSSSSAGAARQCSTRSRGGLKPWHEDYPGSAEHYTSLQMSGFVDD